MPSQTYLTDALRACLVELQSERRGTRRQRKMHTLAAFCMAELREQQQYPPIDRIGIPDERRYSLAEASRALGVVDMTVLYYIRYSHVLPTREDTHGNLYLLTSDLMAYHERRRKVQG